MPFRKMPGFFLTKGGYAMNKEFELKDGQVYLPMSVNCYKAVKAATDAYLCV